MSVYRDARAAEATFRAKKRKGVSSMRENLRCFRRACMASVILAVAGFTAQELHSATCQVSDSARLSLGGEAHPAAEQGARVALEGDIAIIGAPSDDSVFGGAGAVYIFRSVDGTWAFEQKLIHPDPEPSVRFGEAIDLDEGRLLVGALGTYEFFRGQGAWIYEDSDREWSLVHTLSESPSGTLGDGVAMSGGQAVVVGGFFSGLGAVQWFIEEDGAWEEGSLLNLELDPLFTVAKVEGDRAIISSRFGLESFSRVGDEWAPDQLIEPEGLLPGDDIESMSLAGDVLVVGVPNRGLKRSGAIILRLVDGRWVRQAGLVQDTDERMATGSAVAVGNGVVAVGSEDSDDFSGSVSLLREVDGRWREQAVLRSPDAAEEEQGSFGAGLAFDGSRLIVGEIAPGGAYIFDLPELILGEPESLTRAESLRVDVCGGRPGAEAQIALVALDGEPLLEQVGSGTFDEEGHAHVDVDLGPLPVGSIVTLGGRGTALSGSAVRTNEITLVVED